jgi:hypothetical protein
MEHVHVFTDGHTGDYTVVPTTAFQIKDLSPGRHTIGVTRLSRRLAVDAPRRPGEPGSRAPALAGLAGAHQRRGRRADPTATMSCPVTTSLGAYALAALDPSEEEAVRRHLARCRWCADTYADLAGLVAVLHRLLPPAARLRPARRPPR